jgi:hypothetical protein
LGCPCGAVLRARVAVDGEATRKPVRWTDEGASWAFLDHAATAAEAVTKAKAEADAYGGELLDLFPRPRCGRDAHSAMVRISGKAQCARNEAGQVVERAPERCSP